MQSIMLDVHAKPSESHRVRFSDRPKPFFFSAIAFFVLVLLIHLTGFVLVAGIRLWRRVTRPDFTSKIFPACGRE